MKGRLQSANRWATGQRLRMTNHISADDGIGVGAQTPQPTQEVENQRYRRRGRRRRIKYRRRGGTASAQVVVGIAEDLEPIAEAKSAAVASAVAQGHEDLCDKPERKRTIMNR